MQPTDDQLVKIREVAEMYISDPQAVESFMEVVRVHGLQGVQPMRAVGSLQRQLKVKPGLYPKLLEIDQKFSQESTRVDADKSVEKAKKQTARAKAKVGLKTSRGFFPDDIVPLEFLDEEKFNHNSYPGISNVSEAPVHCIFTDPKEVTPFEVLNYEAPLSPSSKIAQIFKNIWKRRSAGSVVFDMLVEDVNGKHPDELAAVVGGDKALELLRRYSIHWRYCGWFVGYNKETGRFRLLWTDPVVKFPDAEKHEKFDEIKKQYELSVSQNDK